MRTAQFVQTLVEQIRPSRSDSTGQQPQALQKARDDVNQLVASKACTPLEQGAKLSRVGDKVVAAALVSGVGNYDALEFARGVGFPLTPYQLSLTQGLQPPVCKTAAAVTQAGGVPSVPARELSQVSVLKFQAGDGSIVSIGRAFVERSDATLLVNMVSSEWGSSEDENGLLPMSLLTGTQLELVKVFVQNEEKDFDFSQMSYASLSQAKKAADICGYDAMSNYLSCELQNRLVKNAIAYTQRIVMPENHDNSLQLFKRSEWSFVCQVSAYVRTILKACPFAREFFFDVVLKCERSDNYGAAVFAADDDLSKTYDHRARKIDLLVSVLVYMLRGANFSNVAVSASPTVQVAGEKQVTFSFSMALDAEKAS